MGIPVTLMPAIVLEPSFALTSEEIGEKFKGGKISSRSTLVVEGAGVEIEDLELDGALVIKVTNQKQKIPNVTTALCSCALTTPMNSRLAPA